MSHHVYHWVTFESKQEEEEEEEEEEDTLSLSQEEEEEEEILSLSNFQIIQQSIPTSRPQEEDLEEEKEFEFYNCGSVNHTTQEERHMCSPKEVFFQGQILPLKPPSNTIGFDTGSSSSRNRSLGAMSRSHSSDSSGSNMSTNSYIHPNPKQHLYIINKPQTYTTSSSSSSDGAMSRSHSTDSSGSNISNNFYTHPSPKPQVHVRKRTTVPPPDVGLLRFGLLRAVDVDRRRRRRGGEKGKRKEKWWGCKCNEGDALEPIKGSKERDWSVCHQQKEEDGWSGRTLEWVKELQIGGGQNRQCLVPLLMRSVSID